MVIGKWTWWMLSQGIRQWCVIVFIASAGCCVSRPAAASQPSHEGPRLRSVAYVVSHPEVVFAAGDGVFKSTDGGASWVGLRVPFSYGRVMTDPHHAARVIVLQDMHGSDHGDYQESLDGGDTWVPRHIAQRKDNVAGPFFFRLLMHPSRPGVWVAQGVDRLWTTQDAGVSWALGPDLGLPRATSGLVVTSKAFYVSAAAQVWRSEDGKNWLPVGSPNGSNVQGMALVAGDRVAVKSGDDWWTRSEQETWEAGFSFPAHELGKKLSAEPKGPFTRRIDSCRTVQSPADSAYLVASCSKVSGGVSISYSDQLHSFDGGLSWALIGGAGLPSAWFPTVIAPHPRDSNSLLMAWVSGRLFRSRDHGATWEASDAGLRIPRSVEDMDHDFSIVARPVLEYPRETRLNKAVIADNLAAVQQLAAAGADLNERGPAGLSAVEWALSLGAHVKWPRRADAMYWALRELGAAIPSQAHFYAKSVWRAVEHGEFGRVLEDLLRSGWQLTTTLGGGEETLLGDQVRRHCSGEWDSKVPKPCVSTLAGRPLEHWVDLHLSQAQPGDSAQLAIDLAAARQLALAERVLAFDAGRYHSISEVVRLLESLPEQAPGLHRQVFDGYKGRGEQLIAGGTIYGALKIEHLAPNWVLEVLPTDRSTITPENAALLVQSLLSPLNRPDWVTALVRGQRGPRIDKQGWQAISDALVYSCEPGLLASALRSGVPVKNIFGDEGLEGALQVALRGCMGRDASIRNSHLLTLHRAGVRLQKDDEWNLDPEEIAELRRSALWPYYRGRVGTAAGIGLRIGLIEAGGLPKVVDVVAGWPAHESGVRPGDQIAAVDGVSTRGKTQNECNLLIRGKPGTKVALTLVHPDGSHSLVHLRRKSLLHAYQSASGKK